MVTGATQNLGYTIASAFAQKGARVLIHGPSEESVHDALGRMCEDGSRAEISGVVFDLGDERATVEALAGLSREGLEPDILINNAASLGLGESGFLQQSGEFFRQVMEVNLFGTFRCSQWAAQGMLVRGGGDIINISSLAGERAVHGRSAYNASKAAIDGLTRSMAIELAPHGIRVNAIAPGHVWTPRWLGLDEGVKERRHRNIPCGRPTMQEEIAQLVLFLTSGVSPSLIGANIVIDGGLNAQQVPADLSV